MDIIFGAGEKRKNVLASELRFAEAFPTTSRKLTILGSPPLCALQLAVTFGEHSAHLLRTRTHRVAEDFSLRAGNRRQSNLRVRL